MPPFSLNPAIKLSQYAALLFVPFSIFVYRRFWKLLNVANVLKFTYTLNVLPLANLAVVDKFLNG
jgi:hypothetical protein